MVAGHFPLSNFINILQDHHSCIFELFNNLLEEGIVLFINKLSRNMCNWIKKAIKKKKGQFLPIYSEIREWSNEFSST